MKPIRTSPRLQSGLSLVELMIALTIGLLLLAGLTTIFVNSSEANREIQKTAQQIENGRYAIDILTQNLHHAGYYGHFYDMSSIAAAASPDPCATTDANLLAAMPTGIQGYRAADLATRADVSATSCGGLLTTANLRPGSDIVVVRRASTAVIPVGDATKPTVNNEVYIQANGVTAQVQTGISAVLAAGRKASGDAATIFKQDGTTAAPVRKYMVHVYFVAPCSAGSGANGLCQAGDDSTPTLKRLELGSDGTTRAMRIVPLVEGVEYLKVEYGVDDLPGAPASTATGQTGDSLVDSYSATPADWTTVIAARVFVLVRNTLGTTGFIDDKTYTLGSVAVPAANDNFRRHVFTASVRFANLAGRREIP
jgi:type IV pilus assembly protein PilW